VAGTHGWTRPAPSLVYVGRTGDFGTLAR